MKRFVVEEPVFKTATLFMVGCSFETLKAKTKQELGEFVGQVGQMFTFKEPPYRIVWAAKLDLPVVLHEAFHLVTRICEDRGVPIKAHNDDGQSADETAAFLFEFYAREIVKRIKP